MDLADDVAYSVHDVEDGVVAGRVDLTVLKDPGERSAVWETVRGWYLPRATDLELDEALAALTAQGSWPAAAYDGTRGSMAALKNLTSDLIGRFCGSAQAATFAAYDAPIARYHAELVVPRDTVTEIAVLKGIAAHYVMQSDHRMALQERQRQLIEELVATLLERGAAGLDPLYAEDWHAAPDDAARLRVVIDQVASLTDASALAWHHRLT